MPGRARCTQFWVRMQELVLLQATCSAVILTLSRCRQVGVSLPGSRVLAVAAADAADMGPNQHTAAAARLCNWLPREGLSSQIQGNARAPGTHESASSSIALLHQCFLYHCALACLAS